MRNVSRSLRSSAFVVFLLPAGRPTGSLAAWKAVTTCETAPTVGRLPSVFLTFFTMSVNFHWFLPLGRITQGIAQSPIRFVHACDFGLLDERRVLNDGSARHPDENNARETTKWIAAEIKQISLMERALRIILQPLAQDRCHVSSACY